MIENPQLDLAYSFVNDTNTNVYLTGKAGTGKTTFLKRVKDEVNKRCAVVAPTGVAAINAQGVTIHSLFQLPFGPNVPGVKSKDFRQRRFSKRKINLLKSLDLLIIDEISMVRSDTLDAIDGVLRRYRHAGKPFGGLQLLMIGDLHQLPPVIKQDEWNLLRQHYSTPYFFGSHALEKTKVVQIELKHIYRQESQDFIDLLNKVRDNKLENGVLQKLNSRYIADFQPAEEEGYVTLTSHNRTAQTINARKLKDLDGETHEYPSTVEGDFPEHVYPTETELKLKINAQVMFVKNDPSEEKRFYNGKIGRVVELLEDEILIECPGEDVPITVDRLTWENRKFKLNERTKEVEEQIIGTFTQFPLKLAWAITIHKSQGLTFEKVVIDAADAFAHGQVYVALSRCKSFEGIVLRSKIGDRSVMTDAVVQGYTEEIQENEPDEADLRKSRHDYQCGVLRELFGFSEMKRWFQTLQRTVQKHDSSLVGDVPGVVRSIFDSAGTDVYKVGEKFGSELEAHFRDEALPEKNEKLQERLKKAGEYFTGKLEAMTETLEAIDIITDNKETKKDVTEKLSELEKEVHMSWTCFRQLKTGYDARKMMKVKADAEVDYEASKRKTRSTEKSGKKTKVPADIEHWELFETLTEWRRETALAANLPAYRILSTQAIIEIAEVLPTDTKSLKKVNGIGKVKVQQFGEEVLDMVEAYCEAHDVAKRDRLEFTTGREPKATSTGKKSKKDTKLISYELYKAGKSVAEIAEERGFVQSTILKHMEYYVSKGELSIYEFVEKEKVERIRAYLKETKPASLSEAKAHFGDDVSYGELRMVYGVR